MKHILILALFTMLSISTHATSCSTRIGAIDGLDASTKQNMIVACEQAKAQSLRTSIPEASTADEYVDLAHKWSIVANSFVGAINNVAKELGHTLNEFITTPAGILAAGLIAWEVMGDTASSFIESLFQSIALTCLAIGVGVWRKRILRAMLITGQEHITIKNWFGKDKIITKKTYKTIADLSRKCGRDEISESGSYALTSIAMAVLSIVILFIAFMQF